VDQEVVQSLGLAVGQRIGAEELARVAAAEAHRQAKEQAYLLLSYRQRSRDEIRRKLSGKGFDEATIASVLLSLSDEGLVDDSAFADAWIRSRQTSKPTGKRLLKWELRQKGVEPELVEDALQKLEPDEEYAAALRSARRRLQRIAATDRNAARQRLVGFLQRRGFDWDITRRVLNTLAAEGHWDAVDSE
jgi:regulatory protein